MCTLKQLKTFLLKDLNRHADAATIFQVRDFRKLESF